MGNTLEALVGALLLQRLVGFSPALDRLRDVLGLVVLAAVLSTLVSATVGVTSGWLGGMIPAATFGKAWRTWWLGDAMGDLVVAPLLFVWSGRERLSRPRLWVVEAVVVCVAVGALSLLVFGGVAPNLIDSPYILFPALIWAAVRLGPQGAISAMGLVSAIAVWGTIRGLALRRPVAPRESPGTPGLSEHRSGDHPGLSSRGSRAPEGGCGSAGAARMVGRHPVQYRGCRHHNRHTGPGDVYESVAAAVTGWPEAEAWARTSRRCFRLSTSIPVR